MLQDYLRMFLPNLGHYKVQFFESFSRIVMSEKIHFQKITELGKVAEHGGVRALSTLAYLCLPPPTSANAQKGEKKE